jgi:hypothetical protein
MISSYQERWRDWPFEASAAGSAEYCAKSIKQVCLRDRRRVNELSSCPESFFLFFFT